MSTSTITPNMAYLDEDGGGFVIADDRWTAATLVAYAERDLSGEQIPISSYTVHRCYVRPAVEGDWVLDDYESGVMVCDEDHPEAVRGWRVTP